MRRARELGVKRMQIGILEDNLVAKRFVSNLGFKFVRRFLELKLEACNIDLPDVEHAALITRGLRAGEEAELTRLQNRSFVGTWGFNPNTTEEIVYRLSLSSSSLEDVIMVYEEEKPIGYCWTEVNAEMNAVLGEKRARIHMMGVDPNYQRKGIGKDILMVGVAHLKNNGIEVVELTVDSGNQPARSLYGSVGFEVYSTTEWYEKAVREISP
jgi:mycothiol synthase